MDVLLKFPHSWTNLSNFLQILPKTEIKTAIPEIICHWLSHYKSLLDVPYRTCFSSVIDAVQSLTISSEKVLDKIVYNCQSYPLLAGGFFIFLFLFLIYVVRANKKRDQSDVKTNWDVFDLAKTAHETGHVKAVIRLVKEFRYDVNYKMSDSGLSLFLCACLSGEKDLISFLVTHGADTKVVSQEGDPALYLATYGVLHSPKPDLSVIDFLVKNGCDVNLANDKGFTPLHRAASEGNEAAIKRLLQHGADPYKCSTSGIFPIDLASNSDSDAAMDVLKKAMRKKT